MTLLTNLVGRVVFMPALVLAAALLVKGHAAPGDGFAAGLVAAMAFVILDMSASRDFRSPSPIPEPQRTRYGAVGLVPMLVVAFGPVIAGRPLLTHFPHGRPPAIGQLQLDTTLLFDGGIAILVVALTLAAIHAVDPHVRADRS